MSLSTLSIPHAQAMGVQILKKMLNSYSKRKQTQTRWHMRTSTYNKIDHGSKLVIGPFAVAFRIWIQFND